MSEKKFSLAEVKIEMLPGVVARSIVDPIYESGGAKARARNEDLFFIALSSGQPVGCVRFCVEEKTPMLRSMMIKEEFRGLRIGEKMLLAFSSFLEREGVRDAFCLPYAYLEKFYGKIGFERAEGEEIPAFLLLRMAENNRGEKRVICMKRAGAYN